MNRLLTLTTGGLFAAMAILPVAAFAETSAAPAKDAKAPATMIAPTETKTVTPSTVSSMDVKGHKVETKTEAKAEAKGDTVKHDGVKAPSSASTVQPKPVEPGKS